MTQPALPRLLNILELYKKGQLELRTQPHGKDISNDENLLEILKTELVDQVLQDWNNYKDQNPDSAEEAFFGKPKKGVGNYASRIRKERQDKNKESLFLHLIFFESNKRKIQETAKVRGSAKKYYTTLKGYLRFLIEHNHRWQNRFPDDEELLREYRRWKKLLSKPKK
jgi:hypothetical protein